MKIQSIRGTHDIFGSDLKKFNKIRKQLVKIAKSFNFNEIHTPIFESTTLFSKPLGQQSDVVLKEMYTFLDRNKDSITLRPEYTTPMIRAAISNNLLNSIPCKLFGLGPMFRRERPQKGRYRQFNQINFEIFGTSDYFADVELIIIAHNFLKSIAPNLKFKLFINSLGDKENLKNYKNDLKKYFLKNIKDLSEESQKKIHSNCLRILDSKDSKDNKISLLAPKIISYLSSESLNHYENIKKTLNELKIEFIENPFLVRGLDYYCSTVFEFKTDSLGSQDTLIGGGRYDGLIKLIGGQDLPGIGWAGGVERMILLMDEILKTEKLIHFAILKDNFKLHALKAYNQLSSKNLPVFWNYKYNLKKSLSQASNENASHIVIIGGNEFVKNKYTIKNLINGSQKIVDLKDLEKIINND